jgi:hypothetical protein
MEMVAVNSRMSAAVFALGVFTLATIASEVRAQDPEVEPEATRILKRMTDYVGGLKRFSLNTENMFEDVLVSGQKIQYDFTARVSIQRPNKLRAERVGDILNQVLVYDGETLTVYNREDNYYAVADAPGNIDDLLVFARDHLDIVPPSSDMVFTNAFDLLTANITSGVVVGKSMIGGVKCDHLAFRSPAVDWQIWIADGDEPLPHKYVLTTMDDPAHPQYIILISNWNVAPKPDDALFRFSAPEGAKKIDFIRKNAGHTPGR